MTTQVALDPMGVPAEDLQTPQPEPRKSRRGTETRQRTERMTLRLLPQERQVADFIAEEFGMSSVQALILDAIQPLMSQEAVTVLRDSPDALRAYAEQRGLTSAQALILHALESSVPA